MDLTEPLRLPSPPDAAARTPLPKLAALVPLASGVVLWAVTGSVLALCFAALGPVMMLAGVVDGARQRRRDRRRQASEAAAQWERAEEQLRERHDAERAEKWARHPDLRACLGEQPLPEPVFDAGAALVLGRGSERSGVRVSGGEGERAEEFRERAAWVTEVPVAVALGGGLVVRGPVPAAAAVVRAQVTALCLRFRPSQLGLVGDDLDALGLAQLPHARRPARAQARVVVGVGRLPREPGAALIAAVDGAAEIPEGASHVLELTSSDEAQLRTATGSRPVRPDALSRDQALVIAERTASTGDEHDPIPETLRLSELEPPLSAPGLTAVIARGEHGDVSVDLAGDGPHAIVTGMTGAGKSELLVTWVSAMARAHAPEKVNFVLADFKGGTAFEPLRALAHVAAVVTDLDGDGAARGVTSLRAEMRRREVVLIAAGARDIGDPAVALPRLVIVVDEFAALLGEHPDLGDVFLDIAARGRALGMHLILGTQRAAGVIRDAVAANCPLRLSLRVSDPADSRAVVGVPDAAELPGDAASRGLAIIRRPQDATAQPARIALTSPGDLDEIARRWSGHARAYSPWLPALPERLDIADIEPDNSPGTAVLALADEPEQQRQEPVLLRYGHDRGFALFGGPLSGKSSVIALLAAQQPDRMLIGPDLEAAWDAASTLAAGRPAPPLVLIDDLDALLASFPGEYAHAFAERMEQAVRQATASGSSVVLTASRSSGAIARIADLLPKRGILALPSRTDHIAAGGSAQSFLDRRPPGRAHLDGREVQFARAPHPLSATPHATPSWAPRGLTAVVSAQPQRWAHAAGQLGAGVRIVFVRDLGPDGYLADADGPVVVVGDGEGWQRQWALWQRMRADVEIVVAAECGAELRTLIGLRELPPYARAYADRAWVMGPEGRPQRVLLPLSPGL